MTLKQEIHQMSVRTSLNLIYTMSRSVALMMPLDEPTAAEIVRDSSETILLEAIALYDRLHADHGNENK